MGEVIEFQGHGGLVHWADELAARLESIGPRGLCAGDLGVLWCLTALREGAGLVSISGLRVAQEMGFTSQATESALVNLTRAELLDRRPAPVPLRLATEDGRHVSGGMDAETAEGPQAGRCGAAVPLHWFDRRWLRVSQMARVLTPADLGLFWTLARLAGPRRRLQSELPRLEGAAGLRSERDLRARLETLAWFGLITCRIVQDGAEAEVAEVDLLEDGTARDAAEAWRDEHCPDDMSLFWSLVRLAGPRRRLRRELPTLEADAGLCGESDLRARLERLKRRGLIAWRIVQDGAWEAVAEVELLEDGTAREAAEAWLDERYPEERALWRQVMRQEGGKADGRA